MLDAKQLKVMGLRFARALQIAVRTAGMFSLDHSVTASPIQDSYNQLNAILKEQHAFTFGFVEGRILVDTVLTTARGLNQLEDDFLKRGLSALKFEAGLSVSRYKTVLAMLATPLRKIEEIGGTAPFLARHEIEGVHIFPAGRTQKRTATGDTVLEMDTEAFLRAQNQEEAAASSMFAGLFDSAAPVVGGLSGGPDEIMSRVLPLIEAAMTGQGGEPEKAYESLAQVLKGLRPDAVLAAFPASRREEVRSLPPQEVAAEFVQSRAMDWAVQQLASVPSGGDAFIVEEQVVYALARSLHATQMAEKLAGRLAKFFQEYSFPTHLVEKVQAELNWIALPPEEKHKQLLAIERFERSDFTRLMERVRELMRKALAVDATELGLHYLNFLDREPDQIEIEELSRLPELIAALAGVHTGFAQVATDKLLESLQRDVFESFRHMQVLNALVALSKSAATYEDYDLVQSAGSAMEQLLADNRERHAACCGKMLGLLLPPAAFERVVELYLEKRTDSAWARQTAAMIHRAGAPVVEFLFQRLEVEDNGQNRMAIIRLIARMGPVGLEVVRQRLADSRWYVVRNACVLLGELADPEMAVYVAPVLQHPDARVQRAAAAALIKTRAAGRAQLLAAALPFLLDDVLELALNELMFLKTPETVGDLEKFLFTESPGRNTHITRGVQAVAEIASGKAAAVLARVVTDRSLQLPPRRIALDALLRSSTPAARTELVNFMASFPDDALTAAIRHGIGGSSASAD
jgi:HEAT repeat protein